MHLYEVGKPYNPAVSEWDEGNQYNFRAGGHELLMFYRRPQAIEVRQVSRGPARFAAVEFPPAIFFLYDFGGGWSDAIYSYHLVPPEERGLPPDVTGPERMLLTVMLIDAANGIVKAARGVTFSPEFTRGLHGMLTRQAMADWPGRKRYEAAVAEAYKKYPTSKAMLDAPGVIQCVGGEKK